MFAVIFENEDGEVKQMTVCAASKQRAYSIAENAYDAESGIPGSFCQLPSIAVIPVVYQD